MANGIRADLDIHVSAVYDSIEGEWAHTVCHSDWEDMMVVGRKNGALRYDGAPLVFKSVSARTVPSTLVSSALSAMPSDSFGLMSSRSWPNYIA